MKKNKFGPYHEDAFCQRFNKLFSERALSYEEIGDILGVSRQAIAKYCNGYSYPRSEILIKMSKYFNVSADYLLGISDYETQDIRLADIGEKAGLKEPIISELVIGLEQLNHAMDEEGNIKRVEKSGMVLTPIAKSINYLYGDDGELFVEIWRYIEAQKRYREFCDEYEEVSKLKSKSQLKYIAQKELKAYQENVDATQELIQKANDIFINAIDIYNQYQELRFETVNLREKIKDMFSRLLSKGDTPHQDRVGLFLRNLKLKRESK